MCRKQPGTAVGRLCDRCEGKCVICDSYVRPHTLVRLCAECDFGSATKNMCIVCSAPSTSDAYYCKECVQQEKDRDGCPKVINLGTARADAHYQAKRLGKVK